VLLQRLVNNDSASAAEDLRKSIAAGDKTASKREVSTKRKIVKTHQMSEKEVEKREKEPMRTFFKHQFETPSLPRSFAAIRRGFRLSKRMSTLRNMTFRHALVISLIFIGAACFGADANKSSPEDFIRSLYRFHQPGKDTPDWFGDKRTLSKYFDKELTALFIKDAECQKREQGVCNLDFDPIYDAQDFEKETTNVQIAAVAGQPDLFKVTFTNLETRMLVYRLTNTPGGWRISDIKYPEEPSLKEILSHDIK